MVIGLETHVELSTRTKIFCSCPTDFGGEPNSHCCPVCVGLPGTLPVLNAVVVEYAVKAGLALGCRISEVSKMDRKNYVYPDLPKAYQISQFDMPLCLSGLVELSDGAAIRINRIHIEEDAGKLVHQNGDYYIDYNRGGVPLIEIVTEPDFRSAEQVREYLEKLRLIMRALGVSDCKMQEGSMRCDVNISVRRVGDERLGTRAEIKNMNSIAFIMKALEYERSRQVEAARAGEPIAQETRRYIESTGETEPMRGKEDSDDYRYFNEPDIPYILLTKEYIEELRAGLPELPDAKLARYVSEYGLAAKDAAIIIRYPGLSAYFEEMARISGAAVRSANAVITSIFRRIPDEDGRERAEGLPPAGYLAEAIKLADGGGIPAASYKGVLDRILETGRPFGELYSPEDFAGIPADKLARIAAEAVAANASAADGVLAGREKAIKSLVGAVMRATGGKADPELAVAELRKQIEIYGGRKE
ncbi:MAG: Asp-tRNA(Asn)/Glu-tRNA(Gln) amidotransferase subunit GatB [Clostridiales bacterium]|jgi:aspartyl-tRNA(Asn)/glutamyl-tRNA(Gln) amidotransferase subunit B|nr:Asp-tRNA(Asn)/Glu-tRNA(Gln) amidotransferase subunit GatB [Clostridiales bacterium]